MRRIDEPKILVVDDEPDVLSVTRLAIKSLRHEGKKVEMLTATSGAEGVALARLNPDVAVVLLDVVMETDHAGLEACRAIRAENPFVRILLRTGQPGMAPERETIDEYDIDGYLPKAELGSDRLYVAVRTALRAWKQLVELERHRRVLAAVHECSVSLRSFESLQVSLERVLTAAVLICPSQLAVLDLETFDADGDARRLTLRLAPEIDEVQAEAAASAIASRLAQDTEAQSRTIAGAWEDGYLVPLTLHRQLGRGYLYLAGVEAGELEAQALPLLASHAQNTLYSAVAEQILKAEKGPVFEEMSV